MTEIDIRQLTDLAEKGQGCSLKLELEGLPFEESIKILRAISQQNSKDLLTDNTLPKIDYQANTAETDAMVSLSLGYRNFIHVSYPLISEHLSISEGRNSKVGDHRTACFDRDVDNDFKKKVEFELRSNHSAPPYSNKTW